MKHIFKIALMCLTLCGLPSLINAMSARDIQKVDQAEREAKAVSVIGVDSITNKINTLVSDAGKKGENYKEAFKNLVSAETELGQPGYLARLKASSAEKLATVMRTIGSAYNTLANKVLRKKVVSPLENIQGDLTTLNNFAAQWKALPATLTLKDVQNPFIMALLSDEKVEKAAQNVSRVMENIFVGEKDDIHLNSTILANAPEEIVKFSNIMPQTIESIRSIYESLAASIQDRLINNNDAAFINNMKKNALVKNLLTKVMLPLGKCMDIIVQYAKTEQNFPNNVAIFSTNMKPEYFAQYEAHKKQLEEFGRRIGLKSGWSYYDAAKVVSLCAVGAGAIYAAYQCYHNPDVLIDTYNNIRVAPLQTLKDLGANIAGYVGTKGNQAVQAVKNTPGAVINGVIAAGTYAKQKGVDIVGGIKNYLGGWVPAKRETSAAFKQMIDQEEPFSGTLPNNPLDNQGAVNESLLDELIDPLVDGSQGFDPNMPNFDGFGV